MYGTKRSQNAGLVFDRFAPMWHKAPSQRVGQLKKEGLEAVCGTATRADPALVRGWNLRWEAAARAVQAEPFSLKTDWRLITGLGRKGPLEVGFTFHRYGLPYLPASGVKGLARTAGLLAVAAALGEEGLAALRDHRRAQTHVADESELAALAWALELDTEEAFTRAWDAAVGTAGAKDRKLAGDFRAVFGTTGSAGQAVFLDAIPTQRPALDLDIMNPHYPDYYREQGSKPPADWQSPIPVYFLTVAAGTVFRFAVGWRGRLDERLRDQARAWLEQGLTELGAGGKTSAGYGYFQPAPTPAETTEARVTTVERAAPVAESSAAAPPASPSARVATPLSSEEPIVWRTGTVREFNAQRQRGRLRDDETGDEWHYTLAELADRARTPGKGQRVRYALSGREGEQRVVRVERLQ